MLNEVPGSGAYGVKDRVVKGEFVKEEDVADGVEVSYEGSDEHWFFESVGMGKGEVGEGVVEGSRGSG